MIAFEIETSFFLHPFFLPLAPNLTAQQFSFAFWHASLCSCLIPHHAPSFFAILQGNRFEILEKS